MIKLYVNQQNWVTVEKLYVNLEKVVAERKV